MVTVRYVDGQEITATPDEWPTIPVGGVAPPAPDQPDADDPDAAEAFRFANRAMWQQRVHTVAVELRRGRDLTLAEATAEADADPANHRWRPFQLAFVLLCLLMIYYSVTLTVQVLFLPVLVLLTALFALGVGTWMSALNVKYRDVRFALPFIIQLWLFVSSVILPSSSLPEKWRWLLMLNPMSAIIEGYRSALFGMPFDWPALGIAAVLTMFVLLYAFYSFGRVERSFADII